jgi:hypothetical protein
LNRVLFVSTTVAAIVVLAATPALRALAAGTKVAIPAGTQIQIVNKNVISSGAAKPGDVVDFSVVQSVAVGGWVVIASGAEAQGHVVSGGGYKVSYNPLHPGETMEPVVLQVDYVVSADGGKIKLSATPIEIKGETHRVLLNQAMSPAIAQAGTTFTVKTDHLVHVLAQQRASGYDQ